MKITYTGRQVEVAPGELKKLEARFTKIGKVLDGRHECEAHVILSAERHLHHAEVTVNYYNHRLVGLGSAGEMLAAIHAAAEKLEKQALKARTKWRDTKRAPRKTGTEVETSASAAPPADTPKRVYPVANHRKRKPMTLDEALLEMDGKLDYLAYRDAQTGGISVLVRRRDGHFDLVEA